MGFEESIKNALEGYTVPYNSADWDQLEKNLNSSSKKGNLSTGLFYGVILTAALTFTAFLWYMGDDNKGAGTTSGSDTALVDPKESANSVEAANSMDIVAITTPKVNINEKTNPSNNASNGSEDQEIGSINATDTHLTTDQNEKQILSEKEIIPTNTGSTDQKIDRAGIDKMNTLRRSTNNSPNDPRPNRSSVLPPNDSGNNAEGNTAGNDQEMSLSFSATSTEGCPGSSIDFNVMNMPEGGRYLWNFGDGSFSNKPDPEHVFDKPGSYEVTLLITSTGDGSMSLEPARDLIVIHDAPYSDFSWELEASSNEIPVIHFENTSQNGVRWHWDLGDGTTSNESHPEHIYKNKGTFNVTLTATNQMGCKDQVTRQVEVANDYKLLAPNTFSPNDDGVNDLFIPEALKILDIKFKMSIFEPKTGRLIYETADVNAPWNGRVNNRAAACEKGEYVWVIDVIDGFNAQESYNGKVTLLR